MGDLFGGSCTHLAERWWWPEHSTVNGNLVCLQFCSFVYDITNKPTMNSLLCPCINISIDWDSRS